MAAPRITTDLFAGLFFDLRQISFGRARVLLDNSDRLLLLFLVEGWFAPASLLILKTSGSCVFPAIKPVADRIAISFIDVRDLICGISASAEQRLVRTPTHLLVTRPHHLT